MAAFRPGEIDGIAAPRPHHMQRNFLQRSRVRQDYRARTFVDRLAGRIQRANASLRIVHGQQRASAMAARPLENGFQGGMETDHHAFGFEQGEHARLHHQAAAARDQGAICRMAVFNKGPFHRTKCLLAVLSEDIRNRLFLLTLDLVVAVEGLKSDFLRDCPAHGGFAGAHEAHEVEIDVGWVHYVRSQGNRAPCRLPNLKISMTAAPRYAFASDNTAGICPEALAAISGANAGQVPSYGDDASTAEARRMFDEVFETRCKVFFVFNGTAANAVTLAALCQRHHAVLCHEHAHVETDECGAPEFFTGGSKMLPVAGEGAKLSPAALEPMMHRGHGVHFPKIKALSLTQATELGTLYSPDELRALSAFAQARGLSVQMDGARFSNAAAALRDQGYSPADITWRAGVDVLCFGGTKNGLLNTEAVVFFNRELAREFDYRVKQAGQLASKMRFASAQWTAVLRDGAWLRLGAQANRQAQVLSAGLRALGCTLVVPTEANGVFVELVPAVYSHLQACGWQFHRFVGEHGYRLMCSWETQASDVAAFLEDVRAARVSSK